MTAAWLTPAWRTPIERVDRVDLLLITDRQLVPWEGWPATFWNYVSKQHSLVGVEAQEVVELFRTLEPGSSGRCHDPPWGIAFYERDALLFAATFCYRCDNVYIYTDKGNGDRGFNRRSPSAVSLRQVFTRHLPLPT